MSQSAISGPTGLGAKADEALAILTDLCGGNEEWCQIIRFGAAEVEVEAHSSDDWGPRRLLIGHDGRISRA